MSLTYGNFFLLGVAFVCAEFLYFPLLVIMHLLMPRRVLDRYWRVPHFSPAEIIVCSEGIFRPLRAQKLIATMVFPSIARKRHLEEGMIVPHWYLIAARALIAWGLLSFFGFISTLTGLYAYAVATGRIPAPDMTQMSLSDMLMLACLVFCVMYFVIRRWWPKHWWPLKKRLEE